MNNRKSSPTLFKNDISVANLFADAANGKLESVEEILKKHPKWALEKRNAKNSSGYAYKNVSFGQFAYLIDDITMYKMMVACIKNLSLADRKRVDDDLLEKMQEVEEQLNNFKHYDFNKIADAISADQELADNEIANKISIETLDKLNKDVAAVELKKEDILAEIKKDLGPCEILTGKALILLHLQKANSVGDEYKSKWNSNKKYNWYQTHVIGFLQSQVTRCNEFAFAQGLQALTASKLPQTRSNTLNNHIHINKIDKSNTPGTIAYKGRDDCKLGEHYFIDICYGNAVTNESTQGEYYRNKRLSEYMEQVDIEFQQCVNINRKQNIMRRVT